MTRAKPQASITTTAATRPCHLSIFYLQTFFIHTYNLPSMQAIDQHKMHVNDVDCVHTTLNFYTNLQTNVAWTDPAHVVYCL